ncbi:hypothetical protein ISN76_11180 [Dyella halodurans]|uniref:PH domain-containing protein n=1 Tax=Dyella halodurans TaxID=1920171 RepID=A0ABV9C2P4_9GAMM|nr:PH domain-containing protein [Dyella halodurans]
MAIDISLQALNAKTLSSFLVIAILPLVIVGVVTFSMADGKSQRIVIGGSLLLLALVLSTAFYWQASAIRIKATPDELTVGGGLYQVSLPMSQVETKNIRVRAKDDKNHRVGPRTNGIGMPGFSLGWHRTTGDVKAFVAITVSDKVVVIPTRAGYDILVSPPDPDTFVAEMRNL